MKENDFNYLIRTRRFSIAWHTLSGWIRYGCYRRTWFFSFRNKFGYSNKINGFAYWWQLCILGLNIGYVYKIEE